MEIAGVDDASAKCTALIFIATANMVVVYLQ